jgi:anti-anti-sigma factor
VQEREVGAFEIRSYEAEGVLVLEVTGVLDVQTAPVLKQQLVQQAGTGNGPVVVDLSGVSEIYAAGLTVLPALARTFGVERRLVFCGLRAPFRELMRVTMLDRKLNLSTDVLEAVELVQAESHK